MTRKRAADETALIHVPHNELVMRRAHEIVGDLVAKPSRPTKRPTNDNVANPDLLVLDVDPKTVMKTIAAGICLAGIQLIELHRGRSLPPAENNVDVITADEVAEFLRLDRKTVYDYAGAARSQRDDSGKRMLFSRDAIRYGCARAARARRKATRHERTTREAVEHVVLPEEGSHPEWTRGANLWNSKGRRLARNPGRCRGSGATSDHPRPQHRRLKKLVKIMKEVPTVREFARFPRDIADQKQTVFGRIEEEILHVHICR